MRNKLFISCMLLVATLASCTKNELSDLSKSDDLQTVTITVAPEEVVVTRADNPVGITNFVIEVYTDNTYATPANIFPVDGGEPTNQASNATGTFSMVLDKSKNYDCLFWADNGTSYSTTTLKGVTVAASQKMTEAYQGTQVITGLQATYAVTLKRAVPKITLTESQRLPKAIGRAHV